MVISMLKSKFAKQFYDVSAETLRLWLNDNPELMKKLVEIGYKKRSKLLRPKEIELIRRHFG